MNTARRSSDTEPSRIEQSHNFGGCIPKARMGDGRKINRNTVLRIVILFWDIQRPPVGIYISILIIRSLTRFNDNLEVYRPFGFHLVTSYVEGSVRSNSFREVFAVVRTERLIMKHIGASNRFSR